MVTSQCDKLIEVCCQHPKSPTKKKCADYDNFDDNDDIFGIYEEPLDDTDYEDDIFGEGPVTGTPGQCGKRNNQVLAQLSDLKVFLENECSSYSSSLQHSVDDAEFGEWPHMCAILKKELVGQEVSN